MPLYEYQCEACGSRFELIRKFSDPPLETCPNCGAGPVQKLVSSPAFQFKGSGWYITDYARKSGGDSGTAGKESGTDKQTSSSSTSTGSTGAADKDSSAAKPSTPEKPATTTAKDS